MRPLIPRVRVGDILKGTRNLRHYLQTASTLSYLEYIELGISDERAGKKFLYRPSKDDEFLVTVNAWNVFGVSGREVALLFTNPDEAHLRLKHEGNRRQYPNRMDPTIFSKWFIRTPGKNTDLTTWPIIPYLMRAVLHFNLHGIRREGPVPQFHHQNGYSAPFVMAEPNYAGGWDCSSLRRLESEFIVKGITRPLARKYFGGGGTGPTLDDLPVMEKTIRRACRNPRVAQHLAKGTGIDHSNIL